MPKTTNYQDNPTRIVPHKKSIICQVKDIGTKYVACLGNIDKTQRRRQDLGPRIRCAIPLLVVLGQALDLFGEQCQVSCLDFSSKCGVCRRHTIGLS